MLLKNEIVDCARLSTLCYLDKEALHKCYTCDRPYNKDSYELVFNTINKEPEYIECPESDCQLLVTEYNDHLIVNFRGTESKKDILTDLNMIQEKLILDGLTDAPYVHRGFLNQFLSVKDSLDKRVTDKMSIIFCGHSLGGALATIASLYYSFKHRDKIIKCITFGSPRVGDSYFAKLFNKTIVCSIRYVNDNDPVPCLPSAWRFKHVKGLRWLNEDIIQHEITAWRFYRFIKNSVLDIFGYGYNALNDHSCNNYIKDIISIQ